MYERAHAGLVIAGECERKPAASGRVGASVYTGCFTGVRDKELLRNSDERNRRRVLAGAFG